MRQDLHQENRKVWNEITPIHNSHKADQAGFLRKGGSTLFPEELDLLGDISGKRLLHLQCNAGQDTLSLTHFGAQVTGVDISDEAINFARQLAADAGIPARFERSDIFDWFPAAVARGEQFDRVFSSYGTVVWLSDIKAWARGIESVLKPGGRFVLVEFHPLLDLFQWEDPTRLNDEFTYFGNTMYRYEGGMWDYVKASGEALTPSGYLEGITAFESKATQYQFEWTISDILTALLEAGLRLQRFEEYPYCNGARFYDTMVLREGGRWIMPEGAPGIPLMFGLAAEKDA